MNTIKHASDSSTNTAMTLEDLPPANTKRWVARRKAEVVTAVRLGVITLDEACSRYSLSVEEFLSWQKAIEKNGVPGLRVTHIQSYRNVPVTAK